MLLAGLVAGLTSSLSLVRPSEVGAMPGHDEIVGSPDGCLGADMVPLGNGNVVISDPCWHNDTGAAYLYDAGTRVVLATLTGSAPGDKVGRDVVALPGGNYLVRSPDWSQSRGAITWGNGVSGISGIVSAANSLVGSTPDDAVGQVTLLANGNYVVASETWDRGSVVNAGAVTWGNGVSGISGIVSATNSLVGSQAADGIGHAVVLLSNGNYVVNAPLWNNGPVRDVGAVTWARGDQPTVGDVSGSNSIVGVAQSDEVGQVTALTNGNYTVANGAWTNGAATYAGAVRWCDGTASCTGPFSAANSVVGSHASDGVGFVKALKNGNYIVATSTWDDGDSEDVGAVTWGDGTTGTVGVVSADNSLVGTSAHDSVGTGVAEAGDTLSVLSNGNYVVASPYWNDGVREDVGAITWGYGAGGTVGAVSASNSFIGTQPSERLSHVTSLTNGNYAIRSEVWNDVTHVQTGAITWADGTAGITGTATAANSLLAQVGRGFFSVTALTNGNYVVASQFDNNDLAPGRGAVTWMDGSGPASAVVSTLNSLVGADENDQVGVMYPPFGEAIVPLLNGNYVVLNNGWDDGVHQGSATWGDGSTGTRGVVSADNSLIGTGGFAMPRFGNYLYPSVTPLANGNYVLNSPAWRRSDSGAGWAGALTWASGVDPTVGVITDANSFVGATNFPFDPSPRVYPVPNGQALGFVRFADGEDWDALRLMSGVAPTIGTADRSNSLVGALATRFEYEPTHKLILIGRPDLARVSFITVPGFVPLVPARLMDTRAGEPIGTIDGKHQATGPVVGGSARELDVAGRGGIDVGAAAVILNVTVTQPVSGGFATVFPCGQPRPNASNLNFVRGQTIANNVTAAIGDGGKVCIYSNATTHVIVDVSGYFPKDSGYVARQPVRLLESRPGEPSGTIDGQSEAIGKLRAGTVTELHVAGRASVPLEAAAGVFNVTVTDPDAPGFVTAFPCGGSQPFASNLNFVTGQTIAAAAVVPLGADGSVCFYTHATTHLVVDLVGFHLPASNVQSLNPYRVLESRVGQSQSTYDRLHEGEGPFAGGHVLELDIAGRRGPFGSDPAIFRASVPTSASSVIVNVTVTEPAEAGFVTVYPCGRPRPGVSNLNYSKGQTIANLVIVRVGNQGKICIYNHSQTHLVADVTGYVA